MEAFEQKMKAEGLSQAAIDAFRLNYEQLVAGVTGLVCQHAVTFTDAVPIYSRESQMPFDGRRPILYIQLQVPEKDIEAIDKLPRLADLKSKPVGDVKVVM